MCALMNSLLFDRHDIDSSAYEKINIDIYYRRNGICCVVITHVQLQVIYCSNFESVPNKQRIWSMFYGIFYFAPIFS